MDYDRVQRRQLVELLAGDGFGVREADGADEAIALAGARRPNLILVEVNLPGVCGYELLRRLRALHGDSLPLVLTSRDRTESFDRVAGLLLGADDYLVRPFRPDEVLARVRRLARSAATNGSRSGVGLTVRERQVLELLATGKSQREIASELGISPKTCGKHIERILEKLGVHSRAQAVAVAYREELVAVRS